MATSTTTATPARRPKPFVVKIQLPSTVMVAGSELTGHVVIQNNTGATVTLPRGKGGCTPEWAVSLGNDKIPPIEAFAASCGSKKLVLRPGQNRLRFTMLATYDHCGGTGPDGPVKPACVGSPPQPPPLPPDNYRAILTGSLGGLPIPQPVPVRVTTRP